MRTSLQVFFQRSAPTNRHALTTQGVARDFAIAHPAVVRALTFRTERAECVHDPGRLREIFCAADPTALRVGELVPPRLSFEPFPLDLCWKFGLCPGNPTPEHERN